LASRGVIELLEPFSNLVPEGRQTVFLADLWAHSASYFVGFAGGIVVICSVLRSRYSELKSQMHCYSARIATPGSDIVPA
jgi:hypothetical protein